MIKFESCVVPYNNASFDILLVSFGTPMDIIFPVGFYLFVSFSLHKIGLLECNIQGFVLFLAYACHHYHPPKHL